MKATFRPMKTMLETNAQQPLAVLKF